MSDKPLTDAERSEYHPDLVALAGGVRDGIPGAATALHDCLCEHGYPHAAAWHCGPLNVEICNKANGPACMNGGNCDVLKAILGGWGLTLDDIEADAKNALIAHGYLKPEPTT